LTLGDLTEADLQSASLTSLQSTARNTLGTTAGSIIDALGETESTIGDLPKGYQGGPGEQRIGEDLSVDPFVPDGTGAASRLAPGGGLMASENAGGHLLARHLGLSEADLAARLASQPGIPTASTFATRAEAEAAVSAAFDVNGANVSAWINTGANGRLVLNAPSSGGLVLQRGATAAVPGTGIRVVLQGNGSGGYFILTGFPTP